MPGPGTPFEPGKSGNPGGRPKKDSAVVEAAKAHTADAVRTLAEIMTGDGPPAARVSAAVALLDRGWGKPTQPVDGDGEGGPIKITGFELVPLSVGRSN